MKRLTMFSGLFCPVLVLSSGCDGRGLGAHDPGPDGSNPVPRDAGQDPDADDPRYDCRPQDARSGPNACADIVGYAWTGSDCAPLMCDCMGSDCDQTFATYSDCMTSYAPHCLPASDCASLDLEECELSERCQVIWYGGGCIDPETCSTSGGSDEMLCWEQGYACVPADHPCNQYSWAECDGECYWIEFEQELCFSETCCVTERYGYCHGFRPPDCDGQEIYGCHDPCASVAGYYWDGEFCRPIICCCEGPDCNRTYQTLDGCMNARRYCAANACAEASGYCDYGDYVPGACADGYGRDDYLANSNPGVCGLGICCAPCPDENAPGVTYFGHSPEQCADIDWGCYANARPFDNECGCGCVPL